MPDPLQTERLPLIIARLRHSRLNSLNFNEKLFRLWILTMIFAFAFTSPNGKSRISSSGSSPDAPASSASALEQEPVVAGAAHSCNDSGSRHKPRQRQVLPMRITSRRAPSRMSNRQRWTTSNCGQTIYRKNAPRQTNRPVIDDLVIEWLGD